MKVLEWLSKDVLSLLFIAIMLFIGWMLWRLQKYDDDFDITDAFKLNGKVSRQALIEWGAFLATTFVLLHQEFNNVLSDWYVAAYGAFWIIKGVASILRPAAPTGGK